MSSQGILWEESSVARFSLDSNDVNMEDEESPLVESIIRQ
jgi:hypothetical protein